MLSVYPGIFIQDQEGHITVIFPDLNHLATFGDDMQEAMAMAIDCLAGYIYTAQKDETKLPAPSPLEAVDPKSEDIYENDPDIARIFVSLVSVDVNEYAKAHFNKSVKKTLSIPQWLNDMAVNQKINFSKVLQAALKKNWESNMHDAKYRKDDNDDCKAGLRNQSRIFLPSYFSLAIVLLQFPV